MARPHQIPSTEVELDLQGGHQIPRDVRDLAAVKPKRWTCSNK